MDLLQGKNEDNKPDLIEKYHSMKDETFGYLCK